MSAHEQQGTANRFKNLYVLGYEPNPVPVACMKDASILVSDVDPGWCNNEASWKQRLHRVRGSGLTA